MTTRSFHPQDLFDLSQTAHAHLFDDCKLAWRAIPKIARIFEEGFEAGNQGEVLGDPYIGDQVRIGPGTIIEPGACIIGPAWIGADCVIRHGAYLRGNVVTGDGCVLGNSCEFKNCLLFNEVQVPHFSYVGDSILGHKAHLGAGVICSNLRFDQQEVRVDGIPTGLRKFGAILGDRAEAGCKAVLNPGTILGRRSIVFPGVVWTGPLDRGNIGR